MRSGFGKVVFFRRGDAPVDVTEDTFANAAPNFAIQNLRCSLGFTSPTWNSYPTVRLDGLACPAGGWLVDRGLPHDSDLNQDLNGDGVTLLMAYALRLNPRINLSRQMPQPELNQEFLSLSFHGGARGIRYLVETSTDLRTWNTDGVEILERPWRGWRSRVEVRRDGRSRYLRLRVELE